MADKQAPNKMPWFWIRDTKGYGSVTVTLVYVSFIVTTLAYILSIFQKIGPFEIRSFDVAAAGVYYTPLLATYFGRKWTEAKFNTNGTSKDLPTDPPVSK